MAILRFTTTRLSGLEAAGRLDELQHATLAPLLERELGACHARLFADFETESSDVRAWYVDADRAPRPIGDLPEPEREALRRRVAAMIAEVLDLAVRLAPQSTQKANLARILTAATTFPIEDIWAVGGDPVLVNWGFHRHEVPVGVPPAIRERFPVAQPAPRPVAASDATVAIQPAPLAVAKVERRWRRFLPFLLWAAFAVLVAGCYRTLLPACGLRGPFDPFGLCAGTAVASPLVTEGARLQALVDQTELERTRDRALCPRPPGRQAIVTPPPLPPDAPRGEVEVMLFWQNQADLDLIIECPNGDKLWHSSPGLAACGGQLMRDMNTTQGPKVDNPIEQAAWSSTPGGRFTIKVQLYAYNDVAADSEIPFTVRIKRGSAVETFEGSVKGAREIVTVTAADL